MSAPPEEKTPRDELSDEELILYYYGETRHDEEIRRRLESSPEARTRWDELCRVLAAVDTLPVPEPDARYGERVWNRLRAELEDERARPWWKKWSEGLAGALAPARLKTAGAIAAAAALAFLAGRYWQPAPEMTAPDPAAAEGREQIVASVVADHFERSERLLLELANAPEGAALDVSLERASAEALLGANRLYRQTTQLAGRADLAAVLEELERLLLDLARGPDEISAGELEDDRARIEDVLFKVQVLCSRLRQQETPRPRTTGPPPGGDQA